MICEDLRIVKTRKVLRETFLNMRKEMPAAFDANMNLLEPLFRGRFDAVFHRAFCQLTL